VKENVLTIPKMWNLLGVSAFERELLLLKVKRNFGSVSKNTENQYTIDALA